MRKRIRQLARGRVEIATATPRFSPERLELQVLEGKNLQGEFRITTASDAQVKGMVYSSNPRMECLTPAFDGNEVTIRYEFHSEGLAEGDIQKGAFYIVSSQGEYDLSFVMSVLNLNADSTIGAIRNLGEFTRLAQEKPEEAYRIFASSYFRSILKQQEKVDERFLYDTIAAPHMTKSNMETFLAAAGRKKMIQITFPETSFQYEEVRQKQSGMVRIIKSQWGFVWMDISTEDGFIELSKSRITSEDFLGSLCTYSFYLNPEKMHNGRNYGTILYENAYQKVEVTVCATSGTMKCIPVETREIRKTTMKLAACYADYRMKRIVTGKWAGASIELLNHLMSYQKSVWIELLKAQVYLANGQKQEAEWILDEFKRTWKEERAPEWGYYLYLTTLITDDRKYMDHVTDQVEAIYTANQENPVLFWCRLFLREEYVNHSYRRLLALKKRILEREEENTIFYAESYELFHKEPFLLSELGRFELKILNWARKQKQLTPQITERILQIFPVNQEYSRLLLLLLEACYECSPTEELLTLIVTYLIRNHRYGRRYLGWYEAGINGKVRVTGIYEAYLSSVDPKTVTPMPPVLLLYFKYHNRLALQQKELLYVNIIANQQKDPETYRVYQPGLIQFAMEQLSQGRIDDNLAVIYEEVLKDGIEEAQTAVYMKKILFTHKISCVNKKIARVIVYTSQLSAPQHVSMVNGTGYIQLYTPQYCIVLEDAYGNRYTDGSFYQLEKLMHPSKKIRQCMKLAPGELPYLLYYFTQKNTSFHYSEDEELLMERLLQNPELDIKYRNYLAMNSMEAMSGSDGERVDFYLKQIVFEELSKEEKRKYISFLIRQRQYAKTYGILLETGLELCGASELVPVLTSQIEAEKGEEEDTLLRFTACVFCMGKYNKTMLSYLAGYYNGSTKQMEQLWRAAKSFEADHLWELEERILVQMLYTTEFVNLSEDIFENYRAHGSKEIRQAYLVYFAQEFFTKDVVVSQRFFDWVLQAIEDDPDQPDVMYLAWLKNQADQPARSDQTEHKVELYMDKMRKKDYAFAFFRALGPGVRRKNFLWDQYFVECRNTPGRKLAIYYKQPGQDEFERDVLTEIFAGIYSKKFSLFAGDSVQYYVTENEEAQEDILFSGCLEGQPNDAQTGGNRYERLNEVVQAWNLRHSSETEEAAQSENAGDADELADSENLEKSENAGDLEKSENPGDLDKLADSGDAEKAGELESAEDSAVKERMQDYMEKDRLVKQLFHIL